MPSVSVNASSSALGVIQGVAGSVRANAQGMEHIGDRIRRLRNARGLSQAALAEQLGIKPASVADWELGDTRPSIARLPRLAAVLGTTVPVLLEGEPSGLAKKRNEFEKLLPTLDEEELDLLIRMARQLGKAA